MSRFTYVPEVSVMGMSRHWTILLVGMALLLGSCGGSKESHALPPINQDLLVGKWEAEEPEQFIQGCQFEADKSFAMTIWHMPQPLTGTYSWSTDRKIAVELRL